MKVRLGHEGSLTFRCPGCKQYHTVDINPGTVWNFNGDVDSPTIFPHITVKTHSGATLCHCSVESGKVRYFPDSKHTLSGQHVELPELED